MLVVLLAAQTARLIWMIATPIGPLGEPVAPRTQAGFAAPADLSVLEQFQAPVGAVLPVMASVPVVTAPPAISGYRLHGVRASIGGDGGSAIISGPDGQQASYGPGQTLAPGVTLAALGRDSAVLSGPGGPVRLELGAEPAPAQPPAAPAGLASPVFTAPPVASIGAGSGPASAAVNVSELMSQAVLQPRTQNGRMNGVTLSARGRAPTLQQAGLQPGDVLLSVNGRALDSAERQSEITRELATSAQAEIQFERNGRIMTTRIQSAR